MSDNTSPALDDQPLDVRELRETVIREALSLDIHELKRFSDREYHDIPLDCHAIHFWTSTSGPAVIDEWKQADLETHLNMDLIRGIDRSAIVFKHKTSLLGWMNGALVVTTDRDAHERLVASVSDIIPSKCRSFVAADAVSVTAAFLTQYWVQWRTYLSAKKARTELAADLEAAKHLSKAADHIRLAREAASVEIPAELSVKAQEWKADYTVLQNADKRLVEKRDGAYHALSHMTNNAERRVYNPRR
ncbi:hypothetical protein O9X98_10845 [Agrobacterium salinitolerans]|nr:hypothetical protein [Agrobacterium salinitolerans]